jgi:transposase
LQKLRSELAERSFAHLYETGGMRRVHLRGRSNILKRLLVHAAGFNLSLILRKTLGVGKPRQLQGLCPQLFALFVRFLARLRAVPSRVGPRRATFCCQLNRLVPSLQRASVFAAA